MANNQNVNKVVYGNNTLIDLTGDTVAAGDVRSGKTFHTKDGASATGSLVVPPTPTSITPSNSSPVALTANTPVNPTASGYAISSYTNKTPSSTPSSVSSGSIYKMGGSGYVVDDYNYITPSDSSPVYLSSGGMYRIGNSSGYAISSYPTSYTPSDSSAPLIPSGSIIKASATGYLYATRQAVPSGTKTITSNGTYDVTSYASASVNVSGPSKSVTSLGSITVASTSAVTKTLSSSVKNYRYLLCTMTSWSGGLKPNLANCGVVLIDTDSYSSGWSATGYWGQGSDGSLSVKNVTYTYVSNTSIQVKNNDSHSRTVYFYGIN